MTVSYMLDQVIADTTPDANALGCLDELRRCRAIVDEGTSVNVQLAVYEARGKTEGRGQALQAVADWLAVTTLQ